jgi:myosin heavy subunit|tara:strand:+ start:16560 stop:16820 length:261 start_codon:yes stop_codon:yes gene_type:complete
LDPDIWLPPVHERERDTTANMAHIYENGTRAWQPDPTDGWVASEVVDKKIEGDKVKLVFQLENGEVCREPQQQMSCARMSMEKKGD